MKDNESAESRQELDGAETRKESVSPVDQKDNPAKWLFRAIKGALIGTGAILPGISGGAMSAAFGIYRPMMEFFANPFKSFKKSVRFFLPVAIGFGLGVVGLAKLVSWLLEISAVPVISFFIGCIAATMPMLFKEAEGKRWKWWHWVILLLSTLLTVEGLHALAVIGGGSAQVAMESGTLSWYITWVISGAVFALGAIVPGMSPSSILMYVGLYKPMTDGIGSFDFSVILPMMLGAVLCIALFSKLISWLFKVANKTMFSLIMGVVLGSTVMIIPRSADSVFTVALSVGCAVIGFVLVLLMSKLDKDKEEV